MADHPEPRLLSDGEAAGAPGQAELSAQSRLEVVCAAGMVDASMPMVA